MTARAKLATVRRDKRRQIAGCASTWCQI